MNKNDERLNKGIAGGLLLMAVILLLVMVANCGCRMTRGSGDSYHRVESWNVTPAGKPYLAQRETWRDKNGIGSAGVLASANATALDYSRSNHLGTASATKLGKYSDKPEAEAIKEAGAAAGTVIGEAVKATVKP